MSLSLNRSYGGSSSIVIYAQSPTIIMDEGPLMHSFYKKSLKEITDKIISNYSELSPKVEIEDKINTKYITQYRESNFTFLQRLAARYGQWFRRWVHRGKCKNL